MDEKSVFARHDFVCSKSVRRSLPTLRGCLAVPWRWLGRSYEVFKRLLSDLDEEAALLAVAWMSQGQEVVLDRRIALEAAQIARERRLAMANSLILATARLYDAILWTQDAHFKGMEGVNYIEKQG